MSDDLLHKAANAAFRRETGADLPLEHKIGNAELLRRAAHAELRHAIGGSGETDRRREFGEVDAGPGHGRLMVAHDRGSDTLIVHGVAVSMSELDPDVRAAITSASATFASAETAEEQTNAKALIGLVVGATIERHADFIGAKVRERKHAQRFNV